MKSVTLFQQVPGLVTITEKKKLLQEKREKKEENYYCPLAIT